MTDIKNKLEMLKKEREARARSQRLRDERGKNASQSTASSEDKNEASGNGQKELPKTQRIRDTWEEMEREGNLTTKEKLEQLIHLTRREKHEKSKLRVPSFEPLVRDPVQLIENPFPLNIRYGKVSISAGLQISSETLTCLSRDAAFRDLDLSTALFIDLETTGLSGGTGVVPFLVGMGFYRDEKFWVTQYFLGDLAEEERLIKELGTFFSQMNFQSIVSFNGKNFDMPLLETRFILHRQPCSLSGLPHLDFLYSARSLWKHKHESCRLYHLAREVVEADRSEDIPSAEIPWRYFQYLHTGNFDLIEPILYHNQEDILSLLGAVVSGALIFSEETDSCLADGMDFYGAGKVLERAGEIEKSVRFYRRALESPLSEEVFLSAKKKLSLYLKRNEEWDKALSLWKEMAASRAVSMDQLYALRELAMDFEHRVKDCEEARKAAEEGFVLSRGFSSYYEKDFSYRMERLKRKLKEKTKPGSG